MKIRLWQRLFLALGALSVLALGALFILQQRDFKAGFLAYVNRLTLEQLEMAAVKLGEAHAEAGNWEVLRQDRRRFRAIILGEEDSAPGARRPPPYLEERPPEERDRPAEDKLRPRGPDDRRRPPEGEFRPPPSEGRPPPPEGRPPPRDDMRRGPPDGEFRPRPPRDDYRPPRDDARPPRDEVRPPPPREEGRPPLPREEGRPPLPPRRPDGANIMPRVLLLDAQGQVVVGNPDIPRDAPQLSVKSKGVEVGKLLMAPIPALTRELDTGFAQTQGRHALWIALGVIGFALLLSWALARWLLKPVGDLARGTRSLALGEFAVRLKDTRGDELGDLARDFNRLAAALEQHRDARRQWGADIAHELRTPLAILQAEIQALEDGVREPTPAALSSLRAECERLNGLVEDLYQLALSDRGALEYRFRSIDLANVLRETADLHRHPLSEKGIALEVTPLPAMKVKGDAARLTQLFTNLLANSGRYTDAPGRVVLSASVAAREAIILVEDTAPGVPAAALPRLFDRLFRVEESRSRAAGGSGLGLAIARNIVEAHGGRITAAASSLGGLKMEIHIPLESA
jgi:two-component system sensor histidine kinase BaeS